VNHFAGHLLVEDKSVRTPRTKPEVPITSSASTAAELSKIRAQ
jgi:hypothetical protein